ncbi:Disheveled-associated activator of morphogenesis 1-A [Amphibalanus amphitrite]|uniref:Disheveled-associated activator of morphogenesis 1-A n=1 Tax=Amphibalanus amphitrite TaxID=1232801 RepID=A0A6A4VT47_AMPAM|nr:Disheveled-associated activator of morphogenesis 1-A [Amphibalanus amphitrite]
MTIWTASLDDLTNAGTLTRSRNKVISVVDARRAQNCTILLSKLKLSDKEIKSALMSMDTKDQLPPDMVEQLLKFTPSAEEKALLEEHSDELKSLARADRFLYEISQITHYEARLKSLFYKKRFAERLAELRPRIAAVVEASKELQRSRRLKKLLELVLAFGNYMNRGQRGNAQGFRLESLRRIGDY